MTAVHRAHENVGWSRKVVITLDFVSEVGVISEVLDIVWCVLRLSELSYSGIWRIHTTSDRRKAM